MALAEQNIDVPITVVDQQTPKTAGLTGRLKRLVNAQVVKFQSARLGDAPSAVRIEKREAFSTLSDVVRDSSTGAVINGAVLSNQTLLTEMGAQPVLLSNDMTHVYSTVSAAWLRHAYTHPAFSLTQDFVHTSNSVASTPDVAQAQRRYCYTWYTTASYDPGGGAPQEFVGVYMRVVDENGVALRADTSLSTTDTRIKVVSDGANFWIFSEKGDGTGSFTVRVVDISGAIVATTTIACTYTSGDYWDITAAGFGILLAQSSGGGVKFSTLTYSAGSIVVANNTDAGIAGFHKIGFLTNNIDGNAYLATSDHIGANNNTIRAYRIPSNMTHDHAYAVATSVVDEVANLTGYVVNSSSDVVVAWSVIDNAGSPNYLNNTVFSSQVTFAGASSTLQIDHSMSLASRAFQLGQSYYAVGYYPSNVAAVSATIMLPNQPTYFLIPLASTSQRTAGRFEYASAYADWQKSASPSNFALSSVVFAPDAQVRTALSYRAESVTTTTLVEGARGVSHFTPYNQAGVVTTVGVKAFTFGANQVKAIALDSELLLPGPGATVWSGQEFSEHGVAIAFEQPTLTPQASGGGFAALTPGTYQYVVVGEWTDTNGRRVRSRPSPPATVTVGASQYVALAGYMNHATNKKDLLISIYRTDMIPASGGGFVPSTLHYKITFDVTVGASNKPLYNDNLGTTWSYNDTFSSITANEILYTDKGQLENYPAPPFSRGCVWKDRVWLLAPDGVWFSAERTEGDALWFHPAFRVTLPTDEQPTAVVAATENYLLISTATAWWYLPSTTLPDASGANGSIPSAIELKFNMGCIGDAEPTKLGTVFASSAGGVWLIPRDLSAPGWLSEAMSDSLGGPVTALAVDSRQRIYALLGTTLGVYDMIAGCWYEWGPPSTPELLASLGGIVSYGDGSALVWQQLTGAYVDSQTRAGVTTPLPYNHLAQLNSLHFGGVRNFASLLEMQLIGDTTTASTVNLSLSFDDDPTIVETTSWVTDPAVPFAYSYGPANQLCSAVGVTVEESLGQGQTAGKGFSLELLALTVGLYQGQNRLPDSRRV